MDSRLSFSKFRSLTLKQDQFHENEKFFHPRYLPISSCFRFCCGLALNMCEVYELAMNKKDIIFHPNTKVRDFSRTIESHLIHVQSYRSQSQIYGALSSTKGTQKLGLMFLYV